MSLELDSIIFNHDFTNVTTSAFNIRRNRNFEIHPTPIPEYDKNIPKTPTESCAAYSINDTKEQNVFTTVTFSLTTAFPIQKVFEVKATGGGIMGKLKPQNVVFDAGMTSYSVDFRLKYRKWEHIDRKIITWQWLYREEGSDIWERLAITSHCIYLVLDIPSSPWTQAYGDNCNPWTNLLDVCCSLAMNSRKPAVAALKIVKAIYQNYLLRYDIRSGAPRYEYVYTGHTFNLTNWIDYVLKGNPPSPTFCTGDLEEWPDKWIVNCYDCAASLALMSRVIGVHLNYYFHQPFGTLNYVEPIGRAKCNNPFIGCTGGTPELDPDTPRGGFGNHAYTKMNRRVYDACMKRWQKRPSSNRIFSDFLTYIYSKKIWYAQNEGWLVGLRQNKYNDKTIDDNLSPSTGSPRQETLLFQ